MNEYILQQAAQASKSIGKDNINVFVSPGGFRDSVKYLYLWGVEHATTVNYPACWWLTFDPGEYNLLKNNGLPVLLWTETDNAKVVDILLRSKKAYFSTHFYAQEHRLVNACLSGAARIQLWHGVPAKKIGYAMEVEPGNPHAKNPAALIPFLQDCLSYDSVVIETQQSFDTRVLESYQQAFPSSRTQFKKSGAPRLEALLFPNRFRPNGRKLGTSVDDFVKRPDTKLLMYAPTYRETPFSHAEQVEVMQETTTFLSQYTDYQLLVKLHPRDLVYAKHNLSPLVEAGKVAFVPQGEDAIPWLAITDVLVTDYSSIAFDFATTGKPAVFFHTKQDYKQYTSTRTLSKLVQSQPFYDDVCSLVKHLPGVNSFTPLAKDMAHLADGACYRAMFHTEC